MVDLDGLVERTEARRQVVTASLDPALRARLGQFFTPAAAAELIATMPRVPKHGRLRVLDPGAGVGILTAALVSRVARESPAVALDVVAVELDPTVASHLRNTLDDCVEVAASHGVEVTATCRTVDFTTSFTRFGSPLVGAGEPFDIVVMNPPYGKLPSRSLVRRSLAATGVGCPNLYAAFMAIGAMSLKQGGQLVSITPRSFANGPYFADFRRFLFDAVTLDRIHLFESRSTVFADAKVLQENIILSATRGGELGAVTLSTSNGHRDQTRTRTVPYERIVRPADRDRVVHLEASDEDASIGDLVSALPATLADIGLQVSTGRVVDFRVRDFLLERPLGDSVPLIYPVNLGEGRVTWPVATRKSQALRRTAETVKLTLPKGHFVLVKRFSSKEEKRRIVAAVFEPADDIPDEVGFENHLNVFHVKTRGLPGELAVGLCLWLNSSVVDQYFRTFSGHTQVNATDLRSMRYPSTAQLLALGSSLGQGHWPTQEKIDSLVTTSGRQDSLRRRRRRQVCAVGESRSRGTRPDVRPARQDARHFCPPTLEELARPA